MYYISFFVPGEPVPKGRPRMFRGKDGGIGSYTPDKTTAWEQTIKYHASQIVKAAGMAEGALAVEFDFRMPRPASVSEKKRAYPMVKPDLDNLDKAVMDALNKLVWADDAQVCCKGSLKRYVASPCEAGVYITVQSARGLTGAWVFKEFEDESLV